MSSIIKILSDQVINKIAAGEVVERPSSVVKELVENSIDAGATEICIDIEQAGRRLIRITDNGCGMSKEDAQNAFLRHATSKITSDTDLEAIDTMGFRGEALSSIASVSQVRLTTAEQDAPSGVMIEIESGRILSILDAAAPQGTSLEISHLFYNTPARLKFLKSPATEFAHILTAVSRQAMAHRSVRFRLTHNKKTVLDLPPSLNIKERIFQLYGNEIAENVVEFENTRDVIRVHGAIGKPLYNRADRTHQDFIVNRRTVKNASLTHALYGAYGDLLMRDRHPVAFVFIDIAPELVDVNVHPAKAEVRFRNPSQIHDVVRDVIREVLRSQGTPRAGEVVTTGADSQGVREALSSYMQDLSHRSDGAPEGGPASYFGRRKRDIGMSPLHADYTASTPQGQPAELLPPVSANSDQDIFPFAQIHDSFIVAQSREGMVIVDQHAAHERVLFEKLQDQLQSGHIIVQNMLIPVLVELGPAQGALLIEYLPELDQLGFLVEDFGTGTFMIKAVPALLVGADYKKLLLDILDEVTVHGRSGKMEQLRDEVLSVLACHPAIKVHRHLEQREMETLLHDLAQCRMPHTCPHGRPTLIRFSMDEIKKMFKRL